jgi:hypothetical protein
MRHGNSVDSTIASVYMPIKNDHWTIDKAIVDEEGSVDIGFAAPDECFI